MPQAQFWSTRETIYPIKEERLGKISHISMISVNRWRLYTYMPFCPLNIEDNGVDLPASLLPAVRAGNVGNCPRLDVLRMRAIRLKPAEVDFDPGTRTMLLAYPSLPSLCSNSTIW
jgi:hypothetical protein